jgi:SAM-dependent methyltransferase
MLSRRTVLAALAAPALCAQERKSKMFGDAEAYERFMGRWSSLLAPLLVDFTGTSDGGQMLDVGSGTGVLAFTVARRNPHCRVVGIDPSAEYVAYANSRNSFGDRAKFQTGDAQHLEFADAAFDHSLSLLVFNFIPDRARALAEVVRVTKPGGRVSAAVWDYGGGMRMLRVFWDAVTATDPSAAKLDEAHMPLCRAGELGKLWRDGGLDAIEERPLDIDIKFAAFADYWDPFLLGQGPAGAYVRSLDERRRQTLRGEVKRRLPVGAENAPLSLPARAWAVRGTVRHG